MHDSETERVQIERAKLYLRRIDEGGDLSALLTEDAEISFPKLGSARGKQERGKLFRSLGTYVAKQSHDPATFVCLSGDGHVAIEGRTSGVLADGSSWTDARFCTVLRFDGDLISHVRIHLDPDYINATSQHYPWHQTTSVA